jgi:hypothetical protein
MLRLRELNFIHHNFLQFSWEKYIIYNALTLVRQKWSSLQIRWLNVGTEDLTVVVMKRSTFWDITLFNSLKVHWRFRGTCCLHLQCQKISQARNQHEGGSKQSLFFDPEDGGDMFLWNVCCLPKGYMALDFRR